MSEETSAPAGEASQTDQFVRLLTQNERRVYAFILSLVPNWSDADEILQETNVRLWQEFSRYRPGSDFGAWACTVARFQILTFRKHRARDHLQFSDEFIEKVAQESSAEAEYAEDRHRALSTCIEKLTDANRELLRECYRPGATIREVAAQFGRSIDTTYKTLYRIRRFLHDCIERRMAGERNA